MSIRSRVHLNLLFLWAAWPAIRLRKEGPLLLRHFIPFKFSVYHQVHRTLFNLRLLVVLFSFSLFSTQLSTVTFVLAVYCTLLLSFLSLSVMSVIPLSAPSTPSMVKHSETSNISMHASTSVIDSDDSLSDLSALTTPDMPVDLERAVNTKDSGSIFG